MNSKEYRNFLTMVLHENGVKLDFADDDRIISVTPDDPHVDLSYSVVNGELSYIHLKDEDIEILYDATSELTKLMIVHGRTMHTAEF